MQPKPMKRKALPAGSRLVLQDGKLVRISPQSHGGRLVRRSPLSPSGKLVRRSPLSPGGNPVRRVAPGKKRVAAARPPKPKRRRVLQPRPLARPAAQTSHGPKIVRQAMRHFREIYSKRDGSYFVHDMFTESGLPYPYTATRYFPPHPYFVQVSTPLEGDVVVYAEHMGIYMGGNKMISAEPGPEAVHITATSDYLNFLGYYRWFQDYRR